MSYNKNKLLTAPFSAKNKFTKVEDAWFEEASSSDEWSDNSTFSDFTDYVSKSKTDLINDVFEFLDNKKNFMTSAPEFTPKSVKWNTRFSKKLYISYVNSVVYKYSNVKLVVELIKYYNKHSYFNSRSHIRFINFMLVKQRRNIVRLLSLDDVNNLHKSSYKSLVNLSYLVKNKFLRKQIRDKVLIKDNKYRNLINNLKSSNYYSDLEVEEGEVECILDDDSLEYTYKPKFRVNRRFWENEFNLPSSDYVRPSFKTIIRDKILLKKLRLIIKKYVNDRKKKEYREEIPMFSISEDDDFEDVPLFEKHPSKSNIKIVNDPCCSKHVRPEMMEPEQTSQQQDAGPVVLNTIEQSSSVVPAPNTSDAFWVQNSTSDAIVNLPHASQMEIMARQFEWSNSMTVGYEIFKIDLPGEPIAGNMSHAAAMLFGQYAYWNGDIKVKIHLNTTPFHVGKLIFSWYYAQNFDGNATDRNNIASAIQLPHVCYNASEGGDAILEIPYRNYRSMICTRKKTDDSLHFYLGTLTCRVFNPLTTDVDTVVDGYIHVSILNSKFTGICPRRDVQPEMMPTKALVKTAESALHLIDACVNMDKPNNPAVPVMYTPQFTDSFSTGINDVSNVHALRLDPLGQTQHPAGSTERGETSLFSIARRWGFLKTLTWNKSQNRNMSIFSLPVSPELPFDKYYQTSVKDKNDKSVFASVLPPVSALCCINAYNRGSLEIKVEFINSRYHTGALLASFTPILTDVTFEEAVQSYNATMDLGNTSSYIFKVPYINERPYNPRYNTMYSTNVKLAPIGVFNLFVLNQLRAVTGVSDHVYVNLYLRAGDDFEFAVPVSPLYSINLDKAASTHKSKITPTGVNKFGLATWRYMSPIANRAVVMKAGVGDDTVLQFDNIKPFVVYKKDWATGNKLESPLRCGNYIFGNNKFEISAEDSDNVLEYIAMVIVNNDQNKYTYATSFNSYYTAVSYVRAHRALATKNNPYPNSPTLMQWKEYDSSTAFFYCAIREGAEDSYRDPVGSSNINTYTWVEQYVGDNMPFAMDDVEPQMDIMTDPTIASLATTMAGMRMFGERFSDIKDYCRRYQLYGSFEVVIAATSKGSMIRIPISYLGLDCADVSNGIIRSITREGLIPYLLSMFRFGRGGIRMKVVISGNNSQSTQREDEVYYIQHKPDILPTSRSIVQTSLYSTTPADKILQSGYAYTAFSSLVNNTITVDIPCYIPTNMLMLQAPNYNRKSEILHYFLGVLDLYIPFVQEKSKYIVTLHYAMSDDFQASDFVGFPPMVPLYSVNNFTIQPEMEKEKPIDKPTTSAVALKEPVVETVPKVITPEVSKDSTSVNKATNIFKRVKDSTTNYFKEKTDNFTKTAVREALDLPKPENIKEDTVGQIIVDAIKKFGSEHEHIIVSFVSQIIHCIQHPTITTFVTALLTVLMHLGLNCYPYITKFYTWFTSLFSNGIRGEADVGEDKTEISPEESKRSFVKLLVDLSASAFGRTKDFVKGLRMPDFSSKMFNNIKLGAMTINSVILLLRNVFDIVPRIFKWLGKYINPKKWLRWFMSDKKDQILKWVKDVEYCVDPANLCQMRSNMYNVLTIELLVMIGRDIHSKLNSLTIPVSNSYFLMLIKKLDNLYIDVSKTNLTAGSIGIEPFCICLQGDSQVGKTHVTKALCADILKHIGYKTNEAIFYTRPPHTKHWDGVERQPVCIYDDFLHIKTSESVAETVGEFLLLKSKATFAPPRAAIEDKGKKYNPLIVALTMNEAYPKFNELADDTAWMRRRDVLINVSLKDAYKGMHVKDIPKEVTEKYEHVWFRIRRSNFEYGPNEDDYAKRMVPSEATADLPLDKMVMVETTAFTYKQIRYLLRSSFKISYERMVSEFLKDLKLQSDFSPDSGADFEENVDAYRKWLINHREAFNKREQETLKQAKEFIEKHKCSICNNNICVCDISQLRLNRLGQFGAQPEMAENEDYVDKYAEFCSENFAIAKMRVQSFNFKNDFGKFVMEKPCVHNWIAMNRSDAGYVIDTCDNKYVLVNNETGQLYGVENGDCTCKDRKETSMEALMPFYVAMAGADASFRQKYLLVTEKMKKFSPSESYLRKIESSRIEFYKFLDEKVCVSSWMTKVGRAVLAIVKPLAYVVGLFCTIFILKEGVAFGYNTLSNSFVKAKKESNKLFAKMVESHVVTDDCINNGCNICAIGEMAYTDRISKQASRRKVAAKVQGEMSLTQFGPIDRKLRRNYFFLCATRKGFEPIYCRCLGVQGTWFIAVDHYFHKIQSLPLDTKLEFVTAQTRMEIYLAGIEILTIKNSALVLGRLPVTVPNFTDIVSRFAPQAIIPNVCREAILYVVDIPVNDEKINTYNVTLHSNDIVLHDDTLFVPNIVNEAEMPTTVETYFQYQTSGQGLCGSVLVTEMNCASPIIGIHIAGAKAGGCGYSEVICFETLNNIIGSYENVIIDVEVEGQMFDGKYINFEQEPRKIKCALTGNIEFMGTVPNKFEYRPPVKSKCIHSICYNEITQSTYDVPHISHLDERFDGSPMFNGCMHHTKPVKSFEDKDLDIVVDSVRNEVLAHVIPLRQKIGPLTTEQAICGIPSIPGYDAMEMDTSEGFPFSSIRPKKAHDKRWLFDLDVSANGYTLNKIHSVLTDVMDRKQLMRQRGIVPMTVFTDCLKDLKLPKEKCHKTRIFSISPVDFTIQFRQYFYDFTIAFQAARFDIESAVGINVDSYEWHNMVQLLLNNSTNFVCGDYSKFGPRLMTSCVMRFFSIIVEWYKLHGDNSFENERIRMIMAHEIAFSNHLMLNMVYRVYCGAPSGCPITTILNNGVNMMYIRMAFLNLVCKQSKILIDDVFNLYSLSKIKAFVSLVFYGDDLIMTVKQEICHLFNAVLISEFFKKYDIVFTDALKTGETVDYLNVFSRETSFLKRNIARHESRPIFIAQMDKRAIEETCNWVFKGHNEPEASITACEAMMLNAYGHGSKYYTSLRNKVMQYWQKRKIVPKIPMWIEVDERIFG